MRLSFISFLIGVLVMLGAPRAAAQKPLAKGDALTSLQLKKVLNQQGEANSLNALQKDLTIIDFFATWCVPCIRALPHLKGLKQQYEEQVAVVLISNETEDRLTKFLSARKDFAFPVVVDEGNVWNGMFQPPYLPYTAVIDKKGRVLAITEAASITPQMLEGWLKEKDNSTIVATKTETAPATAQAMNTSSKSSNKAVRLSQDFLYGARTEAPVDALEQQLSNLDFNTLNTLLATDEAKKAFWINLYNGVVQSKLKSNPELYKSRGAFFRKKQLSIAGRKLSLDDIEHGMLRRSKSKWSLGYLNKLFPSATEKALRVARLDWRIHFALNCGAKSCPPIAYYSDGAIDAQLDLAAKAYLASEVTFDAKKNEVQLPKLMSWFRADFEGKKGMIRILKAYGILPQNAYPKIKFKTYDWALNLSNYTNANL